MSKQEESELVRLVTYQQDREIASRLEWQISVLEYYQKTGEVPEGVVIPPIESNAQANLGYLEGRYKSHKDIADLITRLRLRYDSYIASKSQSKPKKREAEPIFPKISVSRPNKDDVQEDRTLYPSSTLETQILNQITPLIKRKINGGTQPPFYVFVYWEDMNAHRIRVYFGPREEVDKRIAWNNAVMALQVTGPTQIDLYRTQTKPT